MLSKAAPWTKFKKFKSHNDSICKSSGTKLKKYYICNLYNIFYIKKAMNNKKKNEHLLCYYI